MRGDYNVVCSIKVLQWKSITSIQTENSSETTKKRKERKTKELTNNITSS